LSIGDARCREENDEEEDEEEEEEEDKKDDDDDDEEDGEGYSVRVKDSLPEEFRSRIQNVAVLVEHFPPNQISRCPG